MAKKGVARYSASESMLGYMYQSRHALFAFLQRNRVAPTVRVSIEKFDDVAFEGGGQADELIQTKHRAVPGSLTDASEDLWKTLRIWSEGVRDKEFPLPGTVFTLLTTETAPDGSAAALLRPGAGRDHLKAEGVLKAVAQTSANQKLKDAFEVFLKLPAKKRDSMLAEVRVHDKAARIDDLGKLLLNEVYYAAPPGQREDFLARLEGWWFRRVIAHLTTAKQPAIRGIELESEMDRLRDGYAEDNLPIEIPLPVPPASPDPSGDPRLFVARLRKIGLTPSRIRSAILDFYRAYVHRARWASGTLLRLNELEQYDEKLLGEWERICDDIVAATAGAGDDEMARLGRELFKRIDNDAGRESLFYIRPRCTEPSISRGTLHKLADEGKLAWHPEDANASRAAACQQGGQP